MPQFTAALAAALLLTACSGKSAAPVHSPTALTGALAQGLIAYVADGGVGVLDPATGKPTIVAPLQAGTFRVAGPVWAPAPNVDHPVLYLTVHDDRPAERRTTAGVVCGAGVRHRVVVVDECRGGSAESISAGARTRRRTDRDQRRRNDGRGCLAGPRRGHPIHQQRPAGRASELKRQRGGHDAHAVGAPQHDSDGRIPEAGQLQAA